MHLLSSIPMVLLKISVLTNVLWVLVGYNFITIKLYMVFLAQLKYWPSSYHTELISILSAISTVLQNSIIQIFTDSQSVISKYTKLICLNPNSPKKFKFTAWPIWHILLNVIKTFNIQLTLHKVQAHFDNPFNNRADQLANQHISASFLNFNYTNSYIPFHTLYWENTQVLQPIRRFIKNICKAHIIANDAAR